MRHVCAGVVVVRSEEEIEIAGEDLGKSELSGRVRSTSIIAHRLRACSCTRRLLRFASSAGSRSLITRSHPTASRSHTPSPSSLSSSPHSYGAVHASPFVAAARTCRGVRRLPSWISL